MNKTYHLALYQNTMLHINPNKNRYFCEEMK